MNDNKNESIGLIAGTASAQEHMHIDASAIEQIGALSLAASSVQESAAPRTW